jgi:hypothetical protein
MTLTHQLPSLRRSIPDPMNCDCWPEATTATTTDVIVSGVSLLRLVDICGTPCVHTAAAVIPGTHGRPSATDGATIVVVRVTAVRPSGNCLHVQVDGDLCLARPILAEARLIGRASTARSMAVLLVASSRVAGGADDRDPGYPVLPGELPGDLRAGDLIAVPCRGMLARRTLAGKRGTAGHGVSARAGHAEDADTAGDARDAGDGDEPRIPAHSASWLATLE